MARCQPRAAAMTSQTKHIFQPVAMAGAVDRILWKRFLCVFYVFWNWADTSTRARGVLGLNRAPASVQARKSREHVQIAALPAAIRLSGLLGRARHSMDAATRLDPERLSTGHEHATQTARIGSGRVVPQCASAMGSSL